MPNMFDNRLIKKAGDIRLQWKRYTNGEDREASPLKKNIKERKKVKENDIKKE